MQSQPCNVGLRFVSFLWLRLGGRKATRICRPLLEQRGLDENNAWPFANPSQSANLKAECWEVTGGGEEKPDQPGVEVK